MIVFVLPGQCDFLFGKTIPQTTKWKTGHALNAGAETYKSPLEDSVNEIRDDRDEISGESECAIATQYTE